MLDREINVSTHEGDEEINDTNEDNAAIGQNTQTISAREIRRRKRRVLSDILESVAIEEEEIDDHGDEESAHSDSINSGDITRRNAAILKAFEKAVEDSKRLGVIHHESDEEVIRRIARFNMGEFKNFQQVFVSTQ